NKLRLLMFATGDTTSPGVEMAGDATAMASLLGVLEKPDPSFDIVTP
ncbi:MAG: linear primary-alkylsulfatase, partial [Mycobacterium sp.]|nr:linear primary-alkylsulfatase [Mycobacterium sp.]